MYNEDKRMNKMVSLSFVYSEKKNHEQVRLSGFTYEKRKNKTRRQYLRNKRSPNHRNKHV